MVAQSGQTGYYYVPVDAVWQNAMMTPRRPKISQETTQVDAPLATKRRLAAILSADVKGFSRLMEADEEGTLRTLQKHRAAMDALISRHDGRIVGTAGDSVLAEFASPVEATRCAVEAQDEIVKRNNELPAERRLEFRIGINLGDVIAEGADLFGDGVNVAARLQGLADPGGIFVSGGIYDQIKTKLPFGYEFLGNQKVKNIAEPVRVYRIHRDTAHMRKSRTAQRRRRWRTAAAAALLVALAGLATWRMIPVLGPTVTGQTESSNPATSGAVRTSIAVLPFAERADNPDAYFSDGIAEDLITALGKFSNVRVTSWNAVAAYRDRAAPPEQLVRDLQVRYVVDGSVRKSGDSVRVTVRLSDAERGILLWSERYDEPLGEIFAVQDNITRRIVGTLAVRVNYLEQERASAKPTSNLSAYDHHLRGRQLFRQFTRAANLRAQEMFEKAVELDPDYAEAYAALAWTHIKAAEMGWTEWPHQALDRSHDLAQTALRLNPSDELALVMLATFHAYRRQYELALGALARATESNPNSATNHAERGWVLLMAGQSREAIRHLEEALRSDPNPTPNTFSNLAVAYYFHERYEDAILLLETAIGRHQHHLPLHIALAAAYGQAGRTDDARRAATDVRRLNPFFEADSYGDVFRDEADRERLQEGLRRAGL